MVSNGNGSGSSSNGNRDDDGNSDHHKPETVINNTVEHAST